MAFCNGKVVKLMRWNHILRSLYSTKPLKKELEYKKCYQVLEISEDSDQETIRKSYIMLVKKYHPDSSEGDVNKFQEIDRAFKTLMDKKSKERWDVEDLDVEEQNIKHTAPQHRQYLSYDGYGSGTIFQRQRQHTKMRAMQAAENVLQHRIQKVTAEENALIKKVPLKHKIKTKYGFDRVVEDLIQEAMSKGQFNNLSGCGKPLTKQNENPYVDFVTHKINEVLIENGFTPEWILLQKEIGEDLGVLRDGLGMERRQLGPNPLGIDDLEKWDTAVEKHRKLVENINKKINKFNLVVPVLNKQKFLVDLSKEAHKVLASGLTNNDVFINEKSKSSNADLNHNKNLFSFLDTLFKK